MLVNGITIPVSEQQDIAAAIKKKTGRRPTAFRVIKRSLDARKEAVKFVYNVEVSFDGTPLLSPKRLQVPTKQVGLSPIVIGSGPCGLFAALMLAKSGLRPILLERGECVEQRAKDIDAFWGSGKLTPNSNVQFGEGGAGTFSDGKLTTLTHSPYAREVLETFVECGAPEEILYLAKPHIGTDILKTVVTNLRKKIEGYGGTVLFRHQVERLIIEKGRLVGVEAAGERFATRHAVLAIGHSARDTFKMLRDCGITMHAKAFSVGVRIEHPQELISLSQYGDAARFLGAADYKLSYHTAAGRGVYTFCMCPGGFVVAAASEPERLVTNGMSYHARDGKNANAALLVGIEPQDYGDGTPLSGIAFQRELEHKAYLIGGGGYKAPCQRLGDFMAGVPSKQLGTLLPTYRPGVVPSNIEDVLPSFITEAMREALPVFGKKIKGYDSPDALLTAVESRTSSPVRIERNEGYESSLAGLYPAGEGAGYAGGIMSAACDGIRVALFIIDSL